MQIFSIKKKYSCTLGSIKSMIEFHFYICRWKTDYEQLNRKEVIREQFCRICEKLHEPILQTQSNTVPSSAQTRRLQSSTEKARSVKAANKIDLPKGRTNPQSIYVNGSQKIYRDLKDWFLIDECTKLRTDKQLSNFVHGVKGYRPLFLPILVIIIIIILFFWRKSILRYLRNMS